MTDSKNFQDIKDILSSKIQKKAPAYQWQDTALRVIRELNVPDFKKSSVFRVCKLKSKQHVENCLNDTKELCKGKEGWKYFFKIVNSK